MWWRLLSNVNVGKILKFRIVKCIKIYTFILYNKETLNKLLFSYCLPCMWYI